MPRSLTSLLCIHLMVGGGSGECCTMHVRFTVDPVLMYKSGAPTSVVIGSDGRERDAFQLTGEPPRRSKQRVSCGQPRVLLTYYREVHRVPDGGRRGHLTLVRPRVPLLRVPHLGRRMAQGQRGNGAWIQSVGLTCKDQSSVCGLWMLWNRRSEVYVCFPVVSRWMSR